jgi:hypothetical protein
MTDEQRAQMQEAFAAMQKLDKDTETAVLKVLDPKQRTRVSQIKLQSQGLNAFRTPELINALKIPEIRAQEIAEILNGQNQARRDAGTPMRELFAQMAANNGNNGGGRPNRQQMQELMANPEFQAKRDAVQKKIDAVTANLDETTKTQVARMLTKKQRDQYDKLLGEPFDLAKLNQGRRGPGGPNGGNNNNANAPAAAEADAAAKPAAPAAPAAGQAPAANGTQPARKSLRDRRSSAPG